MHPPEIQGYLERERERERERKRGERVYALHSYYDNVLVAFIARTKLQTITLSVNSFIWGWSFVHSTH